MLPLRRAPCLVSFLPVMTFLVTFQLRALRFHFVSGTPKSVHGTCWGDAAVTKGHKNSCLCRDDIRWRDQEEVIFSERYMGWRQVIIKTIKENWPPLRESEWQGVTREGLSEEMIFERNWPRWLKVPIESLGISLAKGLRLEHAWWILGKTKVSEQSTF